jgi:hypothetical protein
VSVAAVQLYYKGLCEECNKLNKQNTN